MPGTADQLLIHQLNSHEDRLQNIESALSSLSSTVPSTLARLEESATYIKEKIARVEANQSEINRQMSDKRELVIDHGHRIGMLEFSQKAVKERRARMLKWVGGIVGGIITAAIGFVLGL